MDQFLFVNISSSLDHHVYLIFTIQKGHNASITFLDMKRWKIKWKANIFLVFILSIVYLRQLQALVKLKKLLTRTFAPPLPQPRWQ